ncbi:MAG: 2-C-methyl-D-erythritol 2,4-cyclodiphosphate synthase [Opitutaceae bacterium]|jgi:2-C-methyl-D-erythritol 2,4-cyclodiphosphate synthase
MSSFRIGHGYDIHRLVPHRPLILGGVKFDTDYGLEGHSDADVLTHAICDALLGAAGLPDIGHFFPNTDPSFKDINSQLLLQKVCGELRERGFEIGNVDASVIAEKPRLIARLGEIKIQLAHSMGIAQENIGIKATTNERVDDLGAGLAIAAHAVALIEKARG